jgi:uncharacterized caspase-like protein
MVPVGLRRIKGHLMSYNVGLRHIFLILSYLVGTSVLPLFAQQREPRVALLIGNAAYPDGVAPLKDTINSTQVLADELQKHAFEVYSTQNLSKGAMREALDRFLGSIKPGSTALFFFSGYGIQSNRQNYMLPIDINIWSESEVRREGYGLDSVLSDMHSRGARIKIAILDASRRNQYERRFRSTPDGLAPVGAPINTVLMYAAAPGAVVREGDRSLFVNELVKEIRNSGRIEEVLNRTLISVSRQSNGEQVPWFSSSLVEDFSFVAPGRLAPAPAVPAASPLVPPQISRTGDPEIKELPHQVPNKEVAPDDSLNHGQAFLWWWPRWRR